jgi:cytochrome c-type biogenesis protein CcmH/NrfG
MKLQLFLRLVAIALVSGTALLLTGSVQAQEIDNTVWDDGPTVAVFAQPVPSLADNELQPAVTESTAVSFAAMTTVPLPMKESSASQWTPVEGWLFASLLVCIALVALYALAEAKRANRSLAARTVRVNNGAALY